MATYLKPACAIFLPHTGKFLVAGLANKDLKTWHKSLKKPSFALPEWVNTPAMSTVYGCMGYGSYLVWRDCGGFQGDGVLPLSCYGANLVLTWTFRPLLAKTKNLGVGAIWMVSILGATIATAVTFKQVNSKAGYLVLPYLGWLCYSNLYMFSLWSNNRVRTD